MNYGFHPANLTFRFILEIWTLLLYVQMGYYSGNDIWRYVLAVLFPILMATAWGIFNVPKDRSRSGKAVIRVNGLQRLILELILLLSPCLFVLFRGSYATAALFFLAVGVHYFLSMDRIKWLLAQRG